MIEAPRPVGHGIDENSDERASVHPEGLAVGETASGFEGVLAGKRAWHIERTDVLSGLRAIPDGVVQTVVTSPPYYGLRSYATAPVLWGGDQSCTHRWGVEQLRSGPAQVQGATSARKGRANVEAQIARGVSEGTVCELCGAWRGELGSEPTVQMFVDHLVVIMREIKRVLRDDGTVWLNIGDSYSGSGKGPGNKFGGVEERQNERQGFSTAGAHVKIGDIPAKSLCLIPERLALALSDDGWVIRSRICWAKTSAMPESVQDRPTNSWEPIWLLSKRQSYYYDAEAIRMPATVAGRPTIQNVAGPAAEKNDVGAGAYQGKWLDRDPQSSGTRALSSLARARANGAAHDLPFGETANVRSYWEAEPDDIREMIVSCDGAAESMAWVLGPEAFAESHFAVFPSALAARCVKAGSAEKTCPTCGKPWARMALRGYSARLPACRCYDERYRADYPEARRTRKRDQRRRTKDHWRRVRLQPGLGSWRTVPSVVLDPFSGSGTTVLVSVGLGRRGIGVELNPSYHQMSIRRVTNGVGWEEKVLVREAVDLGPLFS